MSTGSAMGRMILTMMAGFAELERNLISELTAAGYRTKRGGAWHPQTVARVLARGRG